MGQQGKVIIYWGNMLTERTNRLIKDLDQVKEGAICFKYGIDVRDNNNIIGINSRQNSLEYSVKSIKQASDIFYLLPEGTTTIGIYEASLFKDDITLIPTIEVLRDQGYHLIITGVDSTLELQSSYKMPYLATKADKCIKLWSK